MTFFTRRARKGGGASGRLSGRRLLLAGLVVLGMGAAPGPAAADCVLSVGWDEWPPYITREGGAFRGLEYDLLTATADAAGCTLVMKQVPWARALLMLRAGGLDLLYGAGYSAERAEFAKFSVPYRQERFVLVTRGEAGDGPASVSLTDWIGTGSVERTRKLGVFRGNVYGETVHDILARNASTVTLIEVNQNEQMIEMLGAGRLDGFLLEDGVARMELRSAKFPMRRLAIDEQAGDPLHYMFARGVADAVVQRFNAAIRKRLAADR
jgi:polar amino acid transport system substrate-binding protein